ncbi:MAG: putative multidrug resistance ABC transporter ATP-binding/permease protein YheH [Candidatus Heimdallarchaeota archaeon LC_3]|nr:MAG: putative multidrug resistance ABC transporter ATP-binding/permease protein YheH [Candidatus Heimdallarchaeota archaeon LC_3]
MSIHADADKETKKGSFGYSDIQLYRFMFKFALPYKKEIINTLILMLLVSIFTVGGPLLLIKAVDRFSEANITEILGIEIIDKFLFSLRAFFQSITDLDALWFDVGVITLAYLFLQALIYFSTSRQALIIGLVGVKATQNIRETIFEHLQELDMGYHDKNEVGRIMSRATSDVDAIREFLGGAIVQNVLNIFTIFAVALIIILLDPILALVSFLLIPIILILAQTARKFSRPRRKEVRRTNAILMANIAENIGGIKVSKALNRSKENQLIFAERNSDRKHAQIIANKVNISFFTTLLFFSTLGTSLIVLIGGLRIIEGAITLGVLLAFLNMNAIMFRPIVILANFYEQLQDALTGAERIKALLDTDSTTPWNLERLNLENIEGHVRFNNVYFEYLEDKPILNNFSLDIKAGTKLALVGHTGAGKTTIAALLSRMYDPQKGEILIDNNEIKNISLPSYRKHVAVVPQDFFLFSLSIRENLKLGDPNATEDEMWKVLELVGLKKYIKRLDKGLDTPIHERGGRLSIGQRQLVVFAAVLLADPKILILDEATSSVDVFTELLIQKALNVILKDRTAIIIAHRLSTIRDSDQIVVIDKGKIAEKGNHEELLNNKSIYYKLVRNQLELSGLIH